MLCRDSQLEHTIPPPVASSLQPSLDLTDIVPLAAFLLEYPVAYVPASADQTSFLEGVPLDVYQCTFVSRPAGSQCPDSTNVEHSLLKFSCPSIVGSVEAELSPPRLVERLKSRFGARLEGEAGLAGSIIVRHHVETHARVSL